MYAGACELGVQEGRHGVYKDNEVYIWVSKEPQSTPSVSAEVQVLVRGRPVVHESTVLIVEHSEGEFVSGHAPSKRSRQVGVI